MAQGPGYEAAPRWQVGYIGPLPSWRGTWSSPKYVPVLDMVLPSLPITHMPTLKSAELQGALLTIRAFQTTLFLIRTPAQLPGGPSSKVWVSASQGHSLSSEMPPSRPQQILLRCTSFSFVELLEVSKF